VRKRFSHAFEVDFMGTELKSMVLVLICAMGVVGKEFLLACGRGKVKKRID